MLTLQPLCTLFSRMLKKDRFWNLNSSPDLLNKYYNYPKLKRSLLPLKLDRADLQCISQWPKKNTFDTRPNIDSEVVLGVFVSNSSFDFSVWDKMLEQFCLRGQWASCDSLCWKSSTIHADPTMSCEKPSNSYSWPPWHLLIGFIIRTRSRSDWQ